MTITHLFLMYVLPGVCGFVLAWLARPRHWYQHAAAFVCALSLSIGLSYAGFLIVLGVMTGNWPQETTLAGLAYALTWFTIPAIFTIGPASTTGYVSGVLARAYLIHRPTRLTAGETRQPSRS
jgi:hypothetical protein